MALEASAQRAGTISLAQIASLPADGEMQRLRQLSMKYIREAERLERKHARASVGSKSPLP